MDVGIHVFVSAPYGTLALYSRRSKFIRQIGQTIIDAQIVDTQMDIRMGELLIR